MPSRTTIALALIGLLVSATALGLAPVLMPDDYSWVANTISESAAQGIDGAWLARLGLLLFGLSALLTTALRTAAWNRASVWLLATFGALLTAAAAFSTRPWTPGALFDRTEDALHSIAATAMGFAFALGMVALLVLRPRIQEAGRRAMALASVVAATALPVAMGLVPEAQGILQRIMFAVAYLWFATEALRARRGHRDRDPVTSADSGPGRLTRG